MSSFSVTHQDKEFSSFQERQLWAISLTLLLNDYYDHNVLACCNSIRTHSHCFINKMPRIATQISFE
jgi:hypothetical protein